MKKTITLMLSIASTMLVNSTNYYVDPVNGVNSGRDGLSWATAVKDINTAISLASNSTVDNILVKQGTFNFTTQSYSTSDNIYGSCYGNETSPAQRPLIDLDANGIIEPWEFQYPTIFNSTNTSTSPALTLSLVGSTFNGFTITQTATGSSTIKTINCTDVTMTFENNTVKNCNTNSIWASGSVYGLLITVKGTVKNCMFDKNHVYVTATSTSSVLTPIMSVSSGSKVLGCVFRNNLATIDYSAGAIVPSSGLKGMILNVEPGTDGEKSVIGNNLIYNNESVYKQSSSTATLVGGATVCLSSLSSAACNDSIINCTIANNKTTRMLTGGLYSYKSGNLVSYILNNALWNNQIVDATSSTIVKNIVVNSTLTTGLVANNVYNAGSQGLTPTATYVINNLSDLSDNNESGSTDPSVHRFPAQFKKPTSSVGLATDGSVEQANWELKTGSYLIGKGTNAPNLLTDKNGVEYANPRAVGAYEFIVPSGLSAVKYSSSIVSILNSKMISRMNGNLQVYSFSGSKVWSGIVEDGQQIELSAGNYIVCLNTKNESLVQKVIVY